LSSNQADILNSDLDGIWREIEPDLTSTIRTRMALAGKPDAKFELQRSAMSLQDAVETARAELFGAQAEEKRTQNSRIWWQSGFISQIQAAEHAIGEKWNGKIAEKMDAPPAIQAPAIGGAQQTGDASYGTYARRFSSAGSGEQSKDARVNQAIEVFWADCRAALDGLEKAIMGALGFPNEPTANAWYKAFGTDEVTPFDYTPEQLKIIDAAIGKFLTRMAGKERTRQGFVSPEVEDGLIQDHDRFAWSLGVKRATEMTGAAANIVLPERNGPAIKTMLDNAFTRLSEGGRMRLEGTLDDIHGILLGATEAGLNPIEVSRQLRDQFDNYRGWEFERLARTEIATAQNDGMCQEFKAEGVDVSGVENDLPAYHCNCVCGITIKQVGDGWIAVPDIATTACEICQAYA